MEKTLTEVMPELSISPELKECADSIRVNKICVTRDRREVHIYINSSRLISKRSVFVLESAIKAQLFSKKDIKVLIFEHFLMDDINAEEVYAQYKDSILLELKTQHLLDYQLLQKADVSFPEETVMLLDIPDTIINRSRSRNVEKYLSAVYAQRFGLGVSVRFSFHQAQHELLENGQMNDAVTANMLSRAYEAASSGLRNRPQTKDRPEPRSWKGRKGRRLAPEEGFGRDFDGTALPVSDIRDEIGEVVIAGEVISLEVRTTKTGKKLFIFVVTDHTDSIQAKLFCQPEEEQEVAALVKKGAGIILKGRAVIDTFSHEVAISSIEGIKPYKRDVSRREDNAPVKRVELHCHTKMSDMDAVSSVGDIIAQAARFGHKAIAITDHGVVQAFPDAMKAAEKNGIKVLYGCEGYLADVPAGATPEEVMKAKTYHIILIAQNDIGRINLYRMVSESHVKYFHKRPRIPRFLIEECREGILIGSACEAGEVFRGVVGGATDEEMARLVSFYDYLEIQPLGNNEFMLREDRYAAQTKEDLRDFNRRIVRLGEMYGKPVVATCDVHFLNPEDEVYRRIIMAGKGFKDADMQAPLFLRTTEEMLEEFSYLGAEKAEEIVVTNPAFIADCCETILPVRLDKCPPVIDGSEEELRTKCYERARNIYGEKLPEIVEKRLEKELGSIIGNGYAVMYIIAERLVKKSEDDGYVVGSRGSVGSSFAATMSGITEVNPLPAHYVCPSCHYSDFDSEDVKKYADLAGCDMPDKDCPVCGTRMIKDGFNIPFETFLGFTGNKEPDIDLNFSSEYQSRAHEYTEVLFGKGNTFRAGTIESLAEKTAYGFVLKYYEEKGVTKRRCEIERIAKGCEGVRRSTGQHPGGIVVLPKGENMYSFTPVQHPANDMSTSTVTTHFDYHKIEQNLLKLDILGHNDPTMVRRLEELTGLNLRETPLDDKEVMSLFQNTAALGIKPDDIGGCQLGALGLPEFGTDFAMQMLIDAKPTHFADLVRIAGLAHGTDVWLGNAQDLILSGTATLSTAICTRDDIMLYLISMGVKDEHAFKIMESVRKGRGLRPEWIEEMQAADVPQWYIDSCLKIKYMFPKAHAAAYVMMAWRIAWCKVHRPLEYYTAFFSIRATGFNYELMGLGEERMKQHLAAFRRNKDNLTDKEKATLLAMRLAEEMYARGYSFAPIDLYKAHATKFTIVDGKIMPSFSSIDGLGEKAAISIMEEAAKGRFLSREDFINRTKVSKTLADGMSDMGIFGDIPKTNQLSLFDVDLM